LCDGSHDTIGSIKKKVLSALQQHPSSITSFADKARSGSVAAAAAGTSSAASNSNSAVSASSLPPLPSDTSQIRLYHRVAGAGNRKSTPQQIHSSPSDGGLIILEDQHSLRHYQIADQATLFVVLQTNNVTTPKPATESDFDMDDDDEQVQEWEKVDVFPTELDANPAAEPKF
jgi:hypothetical protein